MRIVDLPEDLLVEILSRASEALLARLRCTCKEWNALIKKDERLDKKSKIITLIDSRVYLASIDLRGSHDDLFKVKSQFSLKDPLASVSGQEEVDICNIFHCDGLLLCTTSNNRLVVWNPCSGKTSWIQTRDSNTKFVYYALGKSFTNKYKILRIEQHGNGYVGQCLVEYEIYDFTSSSWRDLGETRDWIIFRLMSRGTYVNGITYWLANSYSGGKGQFLLSFDFSTERFATVSLPGDRPSHIFYALSVAREEQKLCLLATTSGDVPCDVDVWLATKIDQSTGVITWIKFLTVESHFMFCNGMSFLFDLENKVLVCTRGKGICKSFLHIVGEDKYIQLKDHNAGSECSLLVSYVPTINPTRTFFGVGARKAPNTVTFNCHTSYMYFRSIFVIMFVLLLYYYY